MKIGEILTLILIFVWFLLGTVQIISIQVFWAGFLGFIIGGHLSWIVFGGKANVN